MLTRRALLASAFTGREDYLSYITRFADTLLDTGLDRSGPRQTPLWAGVIDARDFTVPVKDVPAVPGIRASDRAIGGCNLYHDIMTLRVFRALSVVTGKPRYAAAAGEYVSHLLRHAQHPATGFLAWGEHLYYDFARDAVAAERRWHELLEWTPPWPMLWEANAEAVKREIAALRFHYYEDNPKSLYNRHAWWDRAEHQKPGGQPWIKHSGLYAYSFLFLHGKTGDPLWRDWGRGAAALYWDHRNPQTNLTSSCIGDPREGSRNATSGAAMLAYWLYKAWQECREEVEVRERALALFSAWERFSYDPARRAWRSMLALSGQPIGDRLIPTWSVAYGDAGILPYGRIAAYLARYEKNGRFEDTARRVANLANSAQVPADIATEALGFALNLNMDLYDLTREKPFLSQAERYAGLAVSKLWAGRGNGGLFVRAAGDPYYESKIGTGDLLAGILRLHMHLSGAKASGEIWSF